MSIRFISAKCSECGASLEIEEGRSQCFCSYCGTKITLQNDHEYIYRHVDEADLKRAETEKFIFLKQLEIEEQKRKSKELITSLKIKGTALLVIVMLISIFLGEAFGFQSLSTLGVACGAVLMMMWMIVLYPKSISDNRSDDSKIKIPSSSFDYEGKNYYSIETMFRSSGFSNVKSIPLNDLTLDLLNRNNTVESVTIDGESLSESRRKQIPNAEVIIYYHSRRQKGE